MTIFSQAPYYDDYNPAKAYHQILFKPGVSVQARELTQIQSIIQNQIKTFGNHIFKHGSIVIPGNSTANLTLPYIKLVDGTTDVLTLIGSTGVGQTSGVTFVIKNAIGATESDPSTLYVGYISGSGQVVANEIILIGAGALALTVANTVGLNTAIGIGASASVNEGVYYVNGYFASVAKQTVIIGKYTSTPTTHVLLKINETIVTSDTDQTLLDPANGSFNFSAPGADRFKLSLILTTLPVATPIGSNITDDYIELMRFSDGVLEEHARYPKYNELEKALARRTFDESGNYVVRGLKVSAREHLKTKYNNGQFTVAQGGDAEQFVVNIDDGKAYIEGFENTTLSKQAFSINKARTAAHINSRTINVNPSFGQYLFVTNIFSLPNIVTRETVKLFTFATGVQVGTAKIIAIDFHDTGSITQHFISKFFITDILMTGGASLENIGYIKSSTNVDIGIVLQKLAILGSGANFIKDEAITVTGIGRSGVVWKWDKSNNELYIYRNSANLNPIINDLITGTNGTGVITEISSVGNFGGNSSVIQLPFSAPKNIGTVGVSYKVFKYISGVTSLNTATLGIGNTVGITIDPLEIGNITAVGPNGSISVANCTLDSSGHNITITDTWAANLPIAVIVAVSKVGIPSKTKTLVPNTQEEGLTPGVSVLLAQADIFKLNSVISTTMGDVTNHYKLDNGQRDFAYLRGRLILVGLPVTGTLTVNYEYFSHHGTGDFFGPESYSVALTDDYELIPNFKSPSDGRFYKLASSIDFRPRENSAGDGYDSLSDMLIPQSRFSSIVDFYIPQIVIVALDKSSKIRIIYGTPKEIPVAPNIPLDILVLARLFIPAYTRRTKDIRITIPKNRGYTMAGLGRLEKRVMNIENFALLSMSEKNTINFDVVDAATGLNRFKSGYLVESFDNPDTISNLGNLEFSVTYTGSGIIPQIERQLIDMTLKTTNNIQLGDSNMVYTLPYTEITFAKQPLSSNQTNLNPFLSFGWTGYMELVPSFDNWVETEYLPMHINDAQTQTTEIHRSYDWQPTAGALIQFTPAPPPIINKTTINVFRTVPGPVIVPITSTGGGDTDNSSFVDSGWVDDSGQAMMDVQDVGESVSGNFAPSDFGSDAGPGDSGGDSGKIICTEFYRTGVISRELWRADIKYSKNNFSEQTMRGYHFWGRSIVKLIRRYKIFAKLIVYPTRWFAEDIAYKMGVKNSKPNIKGMIIREVFFKPISWFIGVFVKKVEWKSLFKGEYTVRSEQK